MGGVIHTVAVLMTKKIKMSIRQASPADAPMLSTIAINAKRSNGYGDVFMDACRDELTVTSEDISQGEYWVAETDIIQGFICLMKGSDQRIGVIHSFFIDPAWQRVGIGKLLWQKILERAKSMSIHSILLDSDPAAVGFYERLGFQVVGEAPSGSIAGRMIPRMKLQIA